MATLTPQDNTGSRSRASSVSSTMSARSNTSNTSRRSMFGSFRDKLKGRSRSPSPSATKNNPFATTNPSVPAPYGEPVPAFPPPAYSEATNPHINIIQSASVPARQPSPAPSASSVMSSRSISTAEDPYAFLSMFDTIFLIDDSSSMETGSRWKEVKDALNKIAPICTAHDADGVDVYFLNARNRSHADGNGFTGISSSRQIEKLFTDVRPNGWTPTGTRINEILQPYLRNYAEQIRRTNSPENCGVKPINMIVITDGQPTDDPEEIIISIAKRLDELQAPPHQVGIQFFQVGNDWSATQALKELDDNLASRGTGCRDIVDTVSWDGRSGKNRVLSGEAILKVVLGAVVKRLDRKNVGPSSLLSPRTGR
ncbi:hypothetical protein QBC35DRAFT_183007 [Podospora australis]|uniref:VWFA domain-containing protein n=1 Tax=Podospora australis TaxID=1536484 RepID=A0AAN6WVC6_9PEZI|nr:hypothetical protein QBC35DRAFT_183007 [Podospora australis]